MGGGSIHVAGIVNTRFPPYWSLIWAMAL